jgi:hypothetical protein
MNSGGEDDPPREGGDNFEQIGSRARTRAREAAERAAAARERALELTTLHGSEPEDVREAQLSAARQSERAREAMRHSAEGHDRTARVHEDAAALEEGQGHAERAAEHRAAAERARRLAAADRPDEQ